MNPQLPEESKQKKKQISIKDQAKAIPGLRAPVHPLASSREALQSLIAKRAYELYVERGCGPGQALDDWREAEREIVSYTSAH